MPVGISIFILSAWNSRKLEIALRWLTRQCGNPQTECRHACMKLVYNLCTLLPGKTTLCCSTGIEKRKKADFCLFLLLLLLLEWIHQSTARRGQDLAEFLENLNRHTFTPFSPKYQSKQIYYHNLLFVKLRNEMPPFDMNLIFARSFCFLLNSQNAM